MTAKKKIILCLALAAGAIILFFIYRGRSLNFFPYLLILLCPLLHLFMMGGHGGHQGGNEKNNNEKKNNH